MKKLILGLCVLFLACQLQAGDVGAGASTGDGSRDSGQAFSHGPRWEMHGPGGGMMGLALFTEEEQTAWKAKFEAASDDEKKVMRDEMRAKWEGASADQKKAAMAKMRGAGKGQGFGPGMGMMTEEERAAFKQKIENAATPEEKKAIMAEMHQSMQEKFKNMSQEEKDALKKKMEESGQKGEGGRWGQREKFQNLTDEEKAAWKAKRQERHNQDSSAGSADGQSGTSESGKRHGGHHRGHRGD